MKAVERSDLQLIKSFRKGCQASFEELIGRYSAKAFNLALRLTRNEEDAEEVLQDVFSTVYRKIAGFEGKSQFSSWLYRITVNAAFMRLRKNRNKHTVSLEDVSPHIKNSWTCKQSEKQSADGVTYQHELRGELEIAVGNLPDEYRPVFVLKDIDGLSNREVGSILGLTIPAVKSRLHRARIMLRKKLQIFYSELERSPAHSEDSEKMVCGESR